MADWRSLLNDDPTGWLLEDDDPSVRYFALRDILGKPVHDSEVMKAKEDIMSVGTVPAILNTQDKAGFWGDAKAFYSAKYRGTVWQLIILAELGADGKDERVRKACEFILDNSQDRESGGFSISTAAKTGGGRHSGVIPVPDREHGLEPDPARIPGRFPSPCEHQLDDHVPALRRWHG